MKTTSKIGILLCAVVCIVNACKKKTTTIPTTPSLTFVSFTQNVDSAIVKFNFTDGDGDIGFDAKDTNSPYTVKEGHYYNFFVTYYEKHNGQFKAIPLKPPLHVRLPRIVIDSKNKTIEGELYVALPAPYYSPLLNKGDTIKFDYYLEDRALNKSQVATSGDIITKY
jgi:hypothetical protein